MYLDDKNNESEQDIIRRKPNKIIGILESISYWYSIIAIVLYLILISILYPYSTTSNESEQQIISFIFIVLIIIVPFHLGIKLGADIYKPRETYFTLKEMKKLNKLVKKGQSINIEVSEGKNPQIKVKTEK